MPTHTHYSRSPITEAILDIRVKLPSGVAPSAMEQVGIDEDGRYRDKNRLLIAHGYLQLGEQVTASTSSQVLGFRFASDDKKQIAQARIDGFTFSRLAPYQNWGAFRDEARRLWTIYRSAFSPEKVERLAVRYVNRLDLPLPLTDFKDYLRTVPEVSSDLPQLLCGFFMHLEAPLVELQSMMVLNEMLIDSPKPDIVSVVLDIDLFRSVDVSEDEEGIWGFFETLREQKNRVFEGCITDRTREMIK